MPGGGPRSTYETAAGLFSRALALIYLVAFASFGMQARGLVGTDGILPLATYFGFARSELGPSAMWKIPTIFWWGPGDAVLLTIAWSGVALAAIAILAKPHSRWHRIIFAILYVYYLSIVGAGQIFMSYQWDMLLLEAGFLAIFLRPAFARVWLFQWLLFRLMFESGLVKITSHDPSWRNLTALSFHYETQPLPTVIGWFAAKLPMWFQKISTAMVFVVELAFPFLIFGTRRMKQIAAFALVGLQLLIFLTGNYTFFNLLAMALCLLLLDDEFFQRIRRRSDPDRVPKANRWVSIALLAFVLPVSLTEMAEMLGVKVPGLEQVVEAQAPFGLVNQYGLFAVMTVTRPEIEVEGSNDGQNWEPYIFRYKAGPLNRAPGWVQPFQPRLDWQMWFAALGSYRENPWFVRLLVKLLEGSKPVLALMERDPFGGKPPRQIRATAYDYHFSSYDELRRTGNWWRRELKGEYFPPINLKPPAQ